MRNHLYNAIILLVILLGVTLLSCEKEVPINAGGGLEDWTEDSHSYLAEPDYSMVFSQTEVQRLDIVINKEYWKAMQDDLENLFVQKAVSNQVPPFPKHNPVYVPCQLFYKGKQWHDVGIRYKGNSSLSFPYRKGIGKLPFRLEFNHFENENPAISGQTFYGFSQLSFVNGFNDISLLHEKIATDVYRDFGVASPHSAFYRIYIDHGEGPVYFGLYTMLEVVFDGPMLLNQFGSETGNCYKPEGAGAHFNDLFLVNSTFFVNKTNPGAGLSDVRSMIRALLSEERFLNPDRWRKELESVFNADHFLKWLAANTCMQNWDTYGRMSHNLYLYNNPANGLLTWIPWDNNATFREGAGDPARSALRFDFSNLDTLAGGPANTIPWPLISYLYSDTVYRQKYEDFIGDFIQGPFSVSKMAERFTEAHHMIAPFVTGEEGELDKYTFIPRASDFENSLDTLINFAATRYAKAVDYLE